MNKTVQHKQLYCSIHGKLKFLSRILCVSHCVTTHMIIILALNIKLK